MPRFAQKRGRSSSRYSTNKRYKKTAYQMKRKSYRRKPTRSKLSFNKKVLAVIKKTAEPKVIHRVLNSLGPIYHNSMQFQQLFDKGQDTRTFPMQGPGNDERNGNEIYAKGWMIRGSFCFAGDRRGTTLRFYMVSPKDGAWPLSYNNVFKNITNNAALDPLDKTKFASTKLIKTMKISDRSAPTTSWSRKDW